MQRPRCEAGIPDYLVCESIHYKQCSKKDRECWEWLHGLIYAGADVVYCAHCGLPDDCYWQDSDGLGICASCKASLVREQPVSRCAHCGEPKDLECRDNSGDLICADCAADMLEMESEPGKEEKSNGKDPKSRYYDQGGLEVLDVIRAKLTPEQWRGYLLGNLIKYSCRANWKGDFERDAEKMNFYSGYLVGTE